MADHRFRHSAQVAIWSSTAISSPGSKAFSKYPDNCELERCGGNIVDLLHRARRFLLLCLFGQTKNAIQYYYSHLDFPPLPHRLIRRATRSRADLRRLITFCLVTPSRAAILLSSSGSSFQSAASSLRSVSRSLAISVMLAIPILQNKIKASEFASSRKLKSNAR